MCGNLTSPCIPTLLEHSSLAGMFSLWLLTTWCWAWNREGTSDIAAIACVTALLLPWRLCCAAVCTPWQLSRLGSSERGQGPAGF